MPNSAEIVFSAKGRLWTLRTTGDASPETVPFAGEDGLSPIVSGSQPGRQSRLAYVRSYTDANVWRVETAVKIVDDVIASAFDVMEKGIYYLERTGSDTRLRYFDLASRTATTVGENLGNVEFGLGASPDGRTIFYTRIDSSVNDLMLVDNFR
jgi:hypothetical protein